MTLTDLQAALCDLHSPDIEEAYLGLVEETAEVISIRRKGIYHGRAEFNESHLRMELADVLAALVIICIHEGLDADDLPDVVVAKLQQRYPEGWRKGGGLRDRT
jgi:NTP pyrophosphatase (non-canonical NTP hydrolase)